MRSGGGQQSCIMPCGKNLPAFRNGDAFLQTRPWQCQGYRRTRSSPEKGSESQQSGYSKKGLQTGTEARIKNRAVRGCGCCSYNGRTALGFILLSSFTIGSIYFLSEISYEWEIIFSISISASVLSFFA